MATPTVWTEPRTARLARLWNEGASAEAIARRMGLSRLAVESRLGKLRREGRAIARRRLERPGRPRHQTTRRCLHCGGPFASEHIGNRICPACLADGPFTGALV